MASTGAAPLPRSLPRTLAVWGTLTLTALSLSWLAAPEWAALTTGPPRSFDQWLRLTAAAAVTACAWWGWLVGTLVVLRAGHGVTPAPRGCPAGLRRLLLAGLGAGLAAGLTGPAYAADRGAGTLGPEPRAPAPLTTLARLAGLPLPDRAVSAATTPASGSTPVQRAPRVSPPAQEVVVVPGDTLWTLAAAGLPEDAPDSAVAARCRRLYAANRALIGPDPDLITPGLRLQVPGDRPDPR